MSAIAQALTLAQSRIGTEVGRSDWIDVDQARIDQFADVTLDHQWIHIDPERSAQETPFGTTIAHGFLTLSLASRFYYDAVPRFAGQVMGINYGFDRLRFISPVRSGSRLRGRFTLDTVVQRSDTELLQTHILTVDIKGSDSPALVAHWLGLACFPPRP
ncbi:MAG: MaoC family dehydratase [Pseudomonadota bacterium]